MFTGCENNSNVSSAVSTNLSATAAFRISPNSVDLASNINHMVFEVIGGSPPFAWSVSEARLGTVSPSNTTSRTVNYYRQQGGVVTQGVNIVRVEDSRTWSAQATVLHGY